MFWNLYTSNKNVYSMIEDTKLTTEGQMAIVLLFRLCPLIYWSRLCRFYKNYQKSPSNNLYILREISIRNFNS